MEMPKPTEAHKKLEQLVGTWIGEEKMHPSPWDPQGGMATGWIVNRPALDGFAVIQDYEQKRGEVVTFRGHGVFCWDPAQETYLLHWFDSCGTPPNVFQGDFEGNVFTVSCETPQGWSRGVFEIQDKNHYAFRMEMSGDGEQWQTLMEGKYTRED
jgi:hypothetical protein